MALSLALVATGVAATAQPARVSLGVFDGWGAFREGAPPRCWALTRGGRIGGGVLRVGFWPNARLRGQVSVAPPAGRAVTTATLRADGVAVPLRGDGATLWTGSATDDAAIIAALRRGSVVRVEASRWQTRFAAAGAASAIDAAGLGCAR